MQTLLISSPDRFSWISRWSLQGNHTSLSFFRAQSPPSPPHFCASHVAADAKRRRHITPRRATSAPVRETLRTRPARLYARVACVRHSVSLVVRDGRRQHSKNSASIEAVYVESSGEFHRAAARSRSGSRTRHPRGRRVNGRRISKQVLRARRSRSGRGAAGRPHGSFDVPAQSSGSLRAYPKKLTAESIRTPFARADANATTQRNSSAATRPRSNRR